MASRMIVWISSICGLLAVASLSSLAFWPREHKPRLEFTELTYGSIQDVVPAVGNVHSLSTVEIGAEISGKVLDVLVDANAKIKAGQILARIDPAPLKAAVDRARARLADSDGAMALAKAQLEAATLAYERTAFLTEQHLLPEVKLQEEKTQRLAAEISLARASALAREARQSLEQALLDQSKAEIRSPIDGFVLERKVSPGQTLNAALSSPTLFILSSGLKQVEVSAMISEADVARVRRGMRTNISVEAYPKEIFPGNVTQVSLNPKIDGRSVTYVATISVENENERLLPGMTASMEIVNAQAIGVLVLPIRALDVFYEKYQTPLSESQIASMLAQFGDTSPPSRYGAMVGNYIKHNLQWVLVERKGKLFVAPVRPGVQDATSFEVIIPNKRILAREVQLLPGDRVLTRVDA